MAHRLAAGSLVVMLATGLAACGGSGGSKSTTTAAGTTQISPAFVQKVAQVCARANTRVAANGPFPYPNFNPLKPDVTLLPKIGAYFAHNHAVEGSLPAQMSALGEPASGRAEWDRLRALFAASQANAIAQTAAAQASNVRAFVATVNRAMAIHQQLSAQGLAAGFPASSPCSKIF